MEYRQFDEVISTYRSRFSGLSEEFDTIRSKWMNLGSLLLDKRILPDLTEVVETVVPWLLNNLQRSLDECGKIAKTEADSPMNASLDSEMKRVSDLLLMIARFLTYIKLAFYQRTVSMEIPYVVAGLPISPESRWGDESYLMAADNLIKDYKAQLNLHGYEWSGFTSYTLLHPQYFGFPGASYIPFSRMFHVVLSSEMKYFLDGFLVLSHELAHALLESYRYKRKHFTIPIIMYRFLYILHSTRSWGRKLLLNNCGNSRLCHRCPLTEELRDLTDSLKQEKFADFVEEVWDNRFIGLMNEITCDVIAMTISGPHYTRALFDYTFRGTTEKEDDGKLLFDHDFIQIFIRTTACNCFAKARNLEWKDVENLTFEKLVDEIYSSINQRPEQRKRLNNCLSCFMNLGRLFGCVLAENAEFILHETFTRSSNPNDVQFRPDPGLKKALENRCLTVEAKPSQIIHACLDLMKNEYKESAVALCSLSNNMISDHV